MTRSRQTPVRTRCPAATGWRRTGRAAHRRALLPCLLLALACLVPLPAVSQPVRAGDMVGSRPELVVDTLDGTRFDLSAQRGRWVVLNFWATWCAPCIKEIPELSALADRLDVVVLGLDYEEIERGELAAFLATHQPRYAIAPVDPWQPPAGFPVPRGLPVTYLVDTTGVVVQAWLGPVDQAMIEQAMREAARPGEARPDPAGADGAGTSTGPGGDD